VDDVVPKTWVRLVSEGNGDGDGAAGLPKACAPALEGGAVGFAGAGGPPKTCVPALGGGGAGLAGAGGLPKTCVPALGGGGAGFTGAGGPPKTCVLAPAGAGADGAPDASVPLEAAANGPGCAGGGCAPKTWVRFPTGEGATGVVAKDWLPKTCVRVSGEGTDGEWAVPKVGVGVTPAPGPRAGGVPPKICVPALGGAGFAEDPPPGEASCPGR
jgi:hypothetical protein